MKKSFQGRGSALRRVLIPFNHRPCFAVCDQHGNLSIFQRNGRQTCATEMEGLSCGLVTPDDEAIVVIRNKHSVKARQKIDVVLTTQRNGRLDCRTIGELGDIIDPKKCGLAIRRQDSITWLLTCRSDGFIMRKMLAQ